MNGLVKVKSRSRKSTFDNKYTKMGILGYGSFGKVFLVEEIRTRNRYAAKVIDKKSLEKGNEFDTEKKICETFAKNLSHKHIVNIHEVFTEQGLIYIIMEHVQGGELLVKIKQNPKITEGQARRWFRELIEAVEYIHKNKIVHRDLKPENVLINHKSQVKICDFGFANIIQQPHDILNTFCGSPYYAAPEVITNTPYEGPPADLWSCGVILYAMLSGTLPFQASTMPDLIEKIRTASFAKPRLISRNAQDLLKRLLCIDAQKRITAQECLVHPWMTENLQPTIKTSVSLNTALKDKQSFGSKDIIIKKYHSALFYKTSFFTRIFKRRVQVAPLDVPLIIEEKVPKVTFGKFKNLFSFTKNSRQD